MDFCRYERREKITLSFQEIKGTEKIYFSTHKIKKIKIKVTESVYCQNSKS